MRTCYFRNRYAHIIIVIIDNKESGIVAVRSSSTKAYKLISDLLASNQETYLETGNETYLKRRYTVRVEKIS